MPEPESNPPRRILGVDPGLEVTGYAVVEARPAGPRVCEAGVIRSAEGRPQPTWHSVFVALYNGIVEVIEQFQPEVVAVEQLFAHYEHPRTAILMAHARGVIFLAAGQHDLPVVSYNATRIKKTITGSGRASQGTGAADHPARAGPGEAAGAARRGRRPGGGAVPLLRPTSSPA